MKYLNIIQRLLFNPHCSYCNWLTALQRKTVDVSFNQSLLIVTVAFNKPELIEKQIELVKRYCMDPSYKHVIVDNSTNKKARKSIEDICSRNFIDYIPVPQLPNKLSRTRFFWYCASEGIALNWFWNILMQKYKDAVGVNESGKKSINHPRYFAIIDHDLLPFKDFSLVEKISGKDFYGVDRHRDDTWYLWPGYLMLDLDAVKSRDIDFMPCFVGKTFLDTGGRNWHALYKDYQRKPEMFAKDKTIRLDNTKELRSQNDIYHRDCIQIIDGAWVHLVNGSNYAKLKGKDKFMMKVIRNLDKLAEL